MNLNQKFRFNRLQKLVKLLVVGQEMPVLADRFLNSLLSSSTPNYKKKDFWLFFHHMSRNLKYIDCPV